MIPNPTPPRTLQFLISFAQKTRASLVVLCADSLVVLPHPTRLVEAVSLLWLLQVR